MGVKEREGEGGRGEREGEGRGKECYILTSSSERRAKSQRAVLCRDSPPIVAISFKRGRIMTSAGTWKLPGEFCPPPPPEGERMDSSGCVCSI